MECESCMEFIVSRNRKTVEIWLTAAEHADSARMGSLAPLFSVYHKRKYTVAIYVSGDHDFYEATLQLLACNKKRSVELIARQSKALRSAAVDAATL